MLRTNSNGFDFPKKASIRRPSISLKVGITIQILVIRDAALLIRSYDAYRICARGQQPERQDLSRQ